MFGNTAPALGVSYPTRCLALRCVALRCVVVVRRGTRVSVLFRFRPVLCLACADSHHQFDVDTDERASVLIVVIITVIIVIHPNHKKTIIVMIRDDDQERG